jgi:hypothetical protein
MIARFKADTRWPRCVIGSSPTNANEELTGCVSGGSLARSARLRAHRFPHNRANRHGILKMSLHHRRTVFAACLIAGMMLVAGPIGAAPSDYALDVQEVGPQHSHITVRLRNTAQGNMPVDGAIVSIDAVVGPETLGAPTMTQSFVARPGPGTGRYTIIPEPGMQPFELLISAEVPGETEPVTADITVPQ